MTQDLMVLIFLIYISLIVCVAFLKPTYVSSRKISLFRCLFPSWRFYEDICYLPVLYYRVSLDAKEFTSWSPVIEKINRDWGNIFINPRANLIHAYNSMLQQLENDKEEVLDLEKDAFVSSVSYQLAKNLVQSKIEEQKDKTKYYQFKISSTMQGNLDDYEDTIISIVHKL